MNLAARVEQKTADAELWVSSTVRDMMLGGRTTFVDRGHHTLKGIDDRWRLYSVSRPREEKPRLRPLVDCFAGCADDDWFTRPKAHAPPIGAMTAHHDHTDHTDHADRGSSQKASGLRPATPLVKANADLVTVAI